jgi:hypothetical protein
MVLMLACMQKIMCAIMKYLQAFEQQQHRIDPTTSFHWAG